MLAVRLVGLCRKAGPAVRVTDVFEARSLADLFARAAGGTSAAARAMGGRALLPAKRRWLTTRFDEPDLFNVGKVGPEIDDLRSATAAALILARHDALRTRYLTDPAHMAEILDVDPADRLRGSRPFCATRRYSASYAKLPRPLAGSGRFAASNGSHASERRDLGSLIGGALTPMRGDATKGAIRFFGKDEQ